MPWIVPRRMTIRFGSQRAVVMAALGGLLAAGACKSAAKESAEQDVTAGSVERAPAPMPVASATPAAPADRAKGDAPARPDGAAAGQPRVIIRTGGLTLEVDDYETVRPAVDRVVRDAGGFVASVDVGRQAGLASGATLVLRIPADRLDAAVAAFGKLGTLRRESLRAEDVSDTYYDLAARLRNAKRMEERLVALAAQAGGVKDLLEVEREVGRMRESIEVMEGQLRGLGERASLATLTIELVTRATYRPIEERGLGARIQDAFASSWKGLLDAGEALLLFLVTVLPWLVPVGGAAWLLRRMLLRRRG
jgi:hypothetical protein